LRITYIISLVQPPCHGRLPPALILQESLHYFNVIASIYTSVCCPSTFRCDSALLIFCFLLLFCYNVIKMFQMLAAVSLFFIFISITSFCLKTHPAMRVPTISVRRSSWQQQSLDPSGGPRRRNVSDTERSATTTLLLASKRRDEAHAAFFYVDSVCNAWFAVELFIRLATSPRPWQTLRSPHNLVDMTATLSFYLDIVLSRLHVDRSPLVSCYYPLRSVSIGRQYAPAFRARYCYTSSVRLSVRPSVRHVVVLYI